MLISWHHRYWPFCSSFTLLARFLACLPAALSLALPCTTCLLHVHYMTITCQLHDTTRGKSPFSFITRSTSIPSSSSIQQHPHLPLQFSLQQSVFFGLCNSWTMLSDKDKDGFFHFDQTGVGVIVSVRWGCQLRGGGTIWGGGSMY